MSLPGKGGGRNKNSEICFQRAGGEAMMMIGWEGRGGGKELLHFAFDNSCFNKERNKEFLFPVP